MSNPEKRLKLREAHSYEEVCVDIERMATSILDFLPEAQSSATWRSATEEFGEIDIQLALKPRSRDASWGKTVTLLDDQGIYLRQYEVRPGEEKGVVTVGVMQGGLPNAFSLHRSEFEGSRGALLTELQDVLAAGTHTYVPDYIRERNEKFDALIYQYHVSGLEYMSRETLPAQIARQALGVGLFTKLKHAFHARARAQAGYCELLDASLLGEMIGGMSPAERANFAHSQRYEVESRAQQTHSHRNHPDPRDETGW